MAATAENSAQAPAFKRVINDTFENVQTRFGDVSEKIKTSVEDIQTKFKSANDDLEKRFEGLKDQLGFDKLNELVARFKLKDRAQSIVDEGVKLTEETIDRLGLVTGAEIDGLKDALDKLAKKLEAVRRKTANVVTKGAFDKLAARVAKLEAAAKAKAKA